MSILFHSGGKHLIVVFISFGPRLEIFNTLLTISVGIELVINHLFTTVFTSAKAMIPFSLLFASGLIIYSKAIAMLKRAPEK